MSFNFDIWNLIPSAIGMVCSTGLGTVLGNRIQRSMRNSQLVLELTFCLDIWPINVVRKYLDR